MTTNPPIRKTVIPAAGLGTRFLPLTRTIPKELLPVLDKPLIQHAVDEAAAAGMEQVIIVTSPGKPALERYFEGASSFLPNILFVTQKEPLGLGHAVLMAADAVGNEPFLVMLPDDLIFHQQSGTEQVLDVYRRYGESVIAVERVPLDEVGRYGIIDGEQTEDHVFQIRGLVEKPDPEHAPSNLAIVGRYIMPPDIFSCLRQTTPGAIGEIQLTDAVSLLLKERPVYARELLGVRHDGGSPLGLLKASVEAAMAREESKQAMLKYLAPFLSTTQS